MSPAAACRRLVVCALFAFLALAVGVGPARAQPRQVEHLGRGLVAFGDGGGVYMSWRLLATDPDDVLFDVYRSTDGGEPVRINRVPLSTRTDYRDATADLGRANSYFMAPHAGGVPLKPSKTVALPANPTVFTEQAHLRIGLRPLPDHDVHFVWVGDLNGDGEFDFIVDRLPAAAGETQKLEAYLADGTFLWRMDMGPGSLDRSLIEPGPTAISVGHGDGVAVFDMNGDNRAEVMVKSAPGVTFGDGTVWPGTPGALQYISVLDGMTGEQIGRDVVPDIYAADGPVTGHFGIAYLDGVRPSLVYCFENRIGNGGFNRGIVTYDFDYRLRTRWVWTPDIGVDKFHQIRIGDVDRDGRDEVLDGGYVVDDDGTLLYRIDGIVHGDRFHVGDLDPARPGLEGYGVLQDHPGGLVEYYYDAATGEILREHRVAGVVDNGRGVTGDVDPAHEGYEYWSFFGMNNAQSGIELAQGASLPWPNFRIWWDGDVGSENLDRTIVEEWNPQTRTIGRLLTGYREGASEEWRGAPVFYGDILGDWREEIIFSTSDNSELIIFVTTDVSDRRLYTLPHNPLYRADLTTKGYYQSNMVDYYLGFGMADPPRPDVFVTPLLEGDADGDGELTASDLDAVEANFGNMGPAGGSLLGDGNGDGVVDGRDALLVRTLVLGACNAADFAEPFGVLDEADALAHLALVADGRGRADVASLWGQLDFFDVLVGLAAFDAGCP